jgi:hypothetical protein
MNKTRIDLDIVLPDVPDERDACVQRIIAATENKKGIDKVHVPETENSKAQLCFHYVLGIIYMILDFTRCKTCTLSFHMVMMMFMLLFVPM